MNVCIIGCTMMLSWLNQRGRHLVPNYVQIACSLLGCILYILGEMPINLSNDVMRRVPIKGAIFVCCTFVLNIRKCNNASSNTSTTP